MALFTKIGGKLLEVARDLRYVASQLVERYFKDHVARSSAELAYYMLFTLFQMCIRDRYAPLWVWA